MSTFPPLANRTPVLVRDPRNGDWAGTLLQSGLFDTSPVLVVVVESARHPAGLRPVRDRATGGCGVPTPVEVVTVKPSLVQPRGGINRVNHAVDYIGHCVVCKLGIYSDMEHGRAKSPLIGKAHAWCGGA